MRWLVSLVVLAAGCSATGAGRHPSAASTPERVYALDRVVFPPVRAGQLSASREWQRSGAERAVTAADDAALRQSFVHELHRVLPMDAAAPLHMRVTLTLQDTGYFEGLAAETADVTLVAELRDDAGHLFRTITLRESAAAPLQRSASRRARLQMAFDRLARRLAAQL